MKRILTAAILAIAYMGNLEAAESPSLETCVKYAEANFVYEAAIQKAEADEAAIQKAEADRYAGYLAAYTETNKVQSKVPEIMKTLINRDLELCREAQPDLFSVLAGMAEAAAAEALEALTPKCHELPGSYPASGDDHAFAQCWQQIDERPNCFVYRDHYHSGDSVRMSGEWECRGGAIGGVVEHGTATIESGESRLYKGPVVVYEGPVVDGKMNGDWVLRFADGAVWEGPVVDGKMNGNWVVHRAGGRIIEKGPYVDNERNGLWVVHVKNGTVAEGPYVDGKRNGDWVVRDARIGTVEKGPYVEGERNGLWVMRYADGTTHEICFRAGESVDC